MGRSIWVIIAIIAVGAAGYFGYRAHDASQRRDADLQHTRQLEEDLEASQLAAREASRLADQEAEARRLAGLKAKQEAEAEARRLAQSAAELEAKELARQQAEGSAERAAQQLETIRAEKAMLEAEARRLREQREAESAEAARNLEEARMALAEMERRKNQEIERQAALIAAYDRGPRSSPVMTQPTSSGEEEEELRQRTRYIFPANYKRRAHAYVPLLPQLDDE